MKTRLILVFLCLILTLSPSSGNTSINSKEVAYTEKKDVTVYVTKTGAKYHRSGCRYLRRSSYAMKLSEASGSYTACSVCNPPKCKTK